jgi:integrase
MRREHRVPLPVQTVIFLRDLKALHLNETQVFPSVRSFRRCMSENTLNAALRRLGYGKDEVTSYGFRATASTLLNETGKWAPDVIERQLGHIEANDVRLAYARGEHWDDRVAMMTWWADFLDEIRADRSVVPAPNIAFAKH